MNSSMGQRIADLPRSYCGEPVERILRRRDAMLVSGAVDVALRGHDRLVSKQLHQGVDADVLIGQSGGERGAQTVDQHTAGTRPRSPR
jgi:hypothetical protein